MPHSVDAEIHHHHHHHVYIGGRDVNKAGSLKAKAKAKSLKAKAKARSLKARTKARDQS